MIMKNFDKRILARGGEIHRVIKFVIHRVIKVVEQEIHRVINYGKGNHMGGSPLPLSVITWTAVHLGATNLVSNHSVIDLYLDNTFQHLQSQISDC